MMHVGWLIAIVPGCVALGILIAAIFAANDDDDWRHRR